MRRFSLSSCFPSTTKPQTPQFPPPLPAPPNPLPELLCSRKLSLQETGHQFNGFRMMKNDELSDREQNLPDTSMQPNNTNSDSKYDTVPVVPCSPPPSMVAESVTYSEFDNLCKINQNVTTKCCLASEKEVPLVAKPRCTSEESILSALVRKQTPILENHWLGEKQRAHWSRDDSTLTNKKSSNGSHRDYEPESQELNDYRRISFPACQTCSRSSSRQNDEVDVNESHSRKRWSVCDRPRSGQVATVASAWEEYFNPALRSSRVLRSHGRASQSSLRGSQTGSSLTSVTSTLKPVNGNSVDTKYSSETTCEITLTPSTVHRMGDQNNNAHPNHRQLNESEGSMTFSSVTSLEEFISSGDYIRIHPQMPEPILTTSSALNTPNTTGFRDDSENCSHIHELGAYSESSESVAQISDMSSSTLTLSEAKTPIEEYPGTISPIYLDVILPNLYGQPETRTIPVPTVLPPAVKPTQPFFRSRSTSTPASVRRPLEITMRRHRISASRSPTVSSNSSGELNGWTSDQEQCGRPKYYRPIRKRGIRLPDSNESMFTSQQCSYLNGIPMDQSADSIAFKSDKDSTRYTPRPNETAVCTTHGLKRRVTVHSFTTNHTKFAESDYNAPHKLDLSIYKTGVEETEVTRPRLINSPCYYANINPEFIRKTGRSLSVTNPPCKVSRNSFQPKVYTCKMDSVTLTDSEKMVSPTPRVNRSRGIYKQKNVSTPNDKNQQIVNSSERPVVNTVAMSPAAQRYEQHVQAVMSQKPYTGGVTPIWYSRLNKGMFKTGDHLHRPAQNECPHIRMSSPALPDGESMDPELWQQKLDLIARWQHEVNSAMQAGETEIQGLSPSLVQNGSPSQCRTDSTQQTNLTPTQVNCPEDPGHTRTSFPTPSMETLLRPSFHPVQAYLINPPGVFHATAYNSFTQADYDNTPFYNSVEIQKNSGTQQLSVTPTMHMVYQVQSALPNTYFATVGNGPTSHNPAMVTQSDQPLHHQVSRFPAVVLHSACNLPNVTKIEPSDLTRTRTYINGGSNVQSGQNICPAVPVQKTLQNLNQTFRFSPPIASSPVTSRTFIRQGNKQPRDSVMEPCKSTAVVVNELARLNASRANRYPVQPGLSNENGGITTSTVVPVSVPASGNPISLMCQSTPQSTMISSAADSTNRIDRRISDSMPIYEGMENWGNWNDGSPVEWTRIPAPVIKRTTALIEPSIPTEKCNPFVPFVPWKHGQVSDESNVPKPVERGRRRSVTRLQLSVPKNSNNDPMTSSQLTQASSTSASIELRPALRRAATISPVRRRPAQKDADALPNGHLANSSGFASAGSITGVQEDTNHVISRPLVPLPVQENGQRWGTNGLPPAADAYPLACDLKSSFNCLGRPQMDSNGSTGNENNSDLDGGNGDGELQMLPESKFLLGRVASNEDICIETETPFTFTIAATDNEICITKITPANGLKQAEGDTEINGPKAKRKVPVKLRLTFGSESNLDGKVGEQKSNPHRTQDRAMYHVDLPFVSNVVRLRSKAKQKNHPDTNHSLRYSLPCISCQED